MATCEAMKPAPPVMRTFVGVYTAPSLGGTDIFARSRAERPGAARYTVLLLLPCVWEEQHGCVCDAVCWRGGAAAQEWRGKSAGGSGDRRFMASERAGGSRLRSLCASPARGGGGWRAMAMARNCAGQLPCGWADRHEHGRRQPLEPPSNNRRAAGTSPLLTQDWQGQRLRARQRQVLRRARRQAVDGATHVGCANMPHPTNQPPLSGACLWSRRWLEEEAERGTPNGTCRGPPA